VREYTIELELDADTTGGVGSEGTFRSRTMIRFLAHEPGPLVLDVEAARLLSVELDDRPVAADLVDGRHLVLHPALGENVVEVDAVMHYRRDGEGLHRAVDPADGLTYLYAMAFLDAAPSIFACFDQPDLKATFTLDVRAPRDWVVISNSRGEQVEPGHWRFDTTPPLSTYHLTLVAGPYHVIHSSALVQGETLPMSLSARRSLAGDLDREAEDLFTITEQSFDECHRLFDLRYPFGAYHQAFVPEFNAGAMENPGCVTLRDQLVFSSRATRGDHVQRAVTVAHELAHMWFGNLVTPRWWDDLWLNESFAEYMGHRLAAEVTDFTDAWVLEAHSRRPWGLACELRPSRHPVAGTEAPDAATALADFDGISYAKGAALLAQLAERLGETVFLDGLRNHVRRHQFGNATMADLVDAWQEAGAEDLPAWVEAWLRTSGADRIELDRAGGRILVTAPGGEPVRREHAFALGVAGPGGWSMLSVRTHGPSTLLPPPAVESLGADPAAAVVLDMAARDWSLTPPDEATLRVLPAVLSGVTDPLLRASVWNGLRSGVALAVTDPARVLDVLVAAVPAEDSAIAVERVLAWALAGLAPVSADPAAVIDAVHAAAAARLAGAPPGSALQLAAVQGWIDSATDTSLLRGVLSGENLLPGIVLDLDLRWRVLVRLAVWGGIEPQELRAAYQAEPTARSEVQHTLAQASLPDPAAKAWAWQHFTGEIPASNHAIKAAGTGMYRWEQPQHARTHVEEYFARLPGTAAIRSGWVLAEAAEGFFPRTALSEDVVVRALQAADAPGLDRALRRVVLDAADDLRRRLTIRRTFAG